MTAPAISVPDVNPTQRRWRSRLSCFDLASLALLTLVCGVALCAPLLAPFDPVARVGDAFAPMGTDGFLLGTDDGGRDMLSRLLYGTRSSLVSAVAVVAITALLGTIIGAVAASCGGWIDSLLMRTTDLFLAMPAVLVAIAVVAALGPSLSNTLLAIGIVWWPAYARIVRNELVSIGARSHIVGAQLTGVSGPRLVARHLLPGIAPLLLITATLDIASIIGILAGLSFFGLGSSAPSPELGAMTFQGLPYFLSHPAVPLVPALGVFALGFSFNLAGDAVRPLLAANR